MKTTLLVLVILGSGMGSWNGRYKGGYRVPFAHPWRVLRQVQLGDGASRTRLEGSVQNNEMTGSLKGL